MNNNFQLSTFNFQLIILLVFVQQLSAQMLTGRVVDIKGQPVPSATVFIHETSHGIMADERGEFQTKIDTGQYTIEISSLGYERKTMTVVIPPEGLSLNIQLTEKIFALREVTVTPGKEDPAYRIMRNVIARAPYHLHQIKSYESDVYFKGSFKIEKIPAILKSQVKDKNSIGRLMVYESHNEIKFREPNNYEQRVIALTSTITKDISIDDKIPVLSIVQNIYDPKILGGLLGPGSFSVYKFKLDDIDNEGDHQLYKIRIIPRKKNSQLVSGWLYVVDDMWSIRQAALETSDTGVNIGLNLYYQEIKPGAFLISSCDMKMNLNVMGIKGGGQFYASVKYNKLETNDHSILTKATAANPPAATSPPATVEQKPLTSRQQKDIQKIEALAAKEELTTREAYKMSQLIAKTVEPDEMKEQKRRLEQPSIDSLIIVRRDSLALFRDSAFWNKSRTMPLQAEELRSYLQRDSLKLEADSIKSADSLQNRTFGRWMFHLLLGEKMNTGKKSYFRYGGLLSACTEYNFVDGFRIGQRIETGINFDQRRSPAPPTAGQIEATAEQIEANSGQVEINTIFNAPRSLSIAPAVYYTTARKEIDFVVDGTLNYAPLRRGRLTVSTGNTIADHAGQNGTGRFANTLGSFIIAANTAKYYQKRFVTVSNRIDVANGLFLTTGFNYENRHDLENNASYNLLNRQPSPNRPHGQTERMPDHRSYVANIMLEYTPRYYYGIRNGQKIYTKSRFPTISVGYKKGFSGDSPIHSSFDNIEASVFQTIRLGLFNHFFYTVNAGTFLSSRKTYLPDYKHFQTNEMFLSGKSLNTGFTMDNYRYATNDKWLQAHAAYSSQYLLLKQLPFMQRIPLEESVHLKTLWIPGFNHNEAGYSIGFGDMIGLGVFVCFRHQNCENVGFVLRIPLNF